MPQRLQVMASLSICWKQSRRPGLRRSILQERRSRPTRRRQAAGRKGRLQRGDISGAPASLNLDVRLRHMGGGSDG